MPNNKRAKSTKVGLVSGADKQKTQHTRSIVWLRVFLVVTLFICTAILAAGYYLNYLQSEKSANADFCQEINKALVNVDLHVQTLEDKVNQIKVISVDASEEREKLLLRAANKYHIILFAHKVKNKIKANAEYKDSLRDLKEFALPAFGREISDIESGYEESVIPNDRIINELKKSVLRNGSEDTSTDDRGWGGKVKAYLGSSFKIKKINESQATLKTSSSVLDQIIADINSGDYAQALKLLNEIGYKDNEIQFAVKVLKARVDAYQNIKKIIGDSLE